MDVSIETQTLRRGIYRIPVYTASVDIDGTLTPPRLSETGTDVVYRWDEALLSIPITDARSIREPVRITIGDAVADFSPGGERITGLGRQLIVPLSDLGIQSLEDEVDFSITFRISGTENLQFLPFGDVTTVEVQADWPSPSFMGGYLPDSRSIDPNGFNASWSVLNVGRGPSACIRPA